MEILYNILVSLDPAIIWAFRLAERPWLGFLLGILVLNLVCVLLGDVTSMIARRLNRKVYGAYHDEMVRNHNLSVRAISRADKAAFKAVNKQANEAFGKYFFSQAGAFSLSIWPLPFALAWMDLRFRDVPLPLPFSVPGVGESVLYPFYFLPMYIVVRILYGKMLRRFAFYRRLLEWTRHGKATRMLRFEDVGTERFSATEAEEESPREKGPDENA